jgi:hypothetical protein
LSYFIFIFVKDYEPDRAKLVHLKAIPQMDNEIVHKKEQLSGHGKIIMVGFAKRPWRGDPDVP